MSHESSNHGTDQCAPIQHTSLQIEKMHHSRPYQKQKVRRGLRVDRINPADLNRYNPAFFCDDCGHYDRAQKKCTMGYAPVHTRAEQMAFYELTGSMAFCRFCEID